MTDKDPEAAAICTSAFPLFGSLSVTRCKSSWTTVCNNEMVIICDIISLETDLNKNSMIALYCPCENGLVIFGIH